MRLARHGRAEAPSIARHQTGVQWLGYQLILDSDATIVPYNQVVIATGEGSNAALVEFDSLIRNMPVR